VYGCSEGKYDKILLIVTIFHNYSLVNRRYYPVLQESIKARLKHYPLVSYTLIWNNEQLHKLTAILRRKYYIILTASWKKILSVLGGVAK